MIKVAISYCPNTTALQTKLKTLYETGQYYHYIEPNETGGYLIKQGLRAPLFYSIDYSQTFGLFKCNPYDEDGNLTGVMAAIYPEIQVLQTGTNKSASDCPWDKLTNEQWELLESIKPRYKTDEDGKPTTELIERKPYGQCSTKSCP